MKFGDNLVPGVKMEIEVDRCDNDWKVYCETSAG